MGIPPLGPDRLQEYELEQKIRHGEEESIQPTEANKGSRRATVFYAIVLLMTAGVICWIVFS